MHRRPERWLNERLYVGVFCCSILLVYHRGLARVFPPLEEGFLEGFPWTDRVQPVRTVDWRLIKLLTMCFLVLSCASLHTPFSQWLKKYMWKESCFVMLELSAKWSEKLPRKEPTKSLPWQGFRNLRVEDSPESM